MPHLVQRTYSASNSELRQTAPAHTTSKPQAPSRCVSFSPDVKVQEIPHLLELSQTEIDETWYNKEECNAIKEEAVQVIKNMMNGSIEKNECIRGLEHRVPDAARRRKEIKRIAFQVVWDTQEDQWDEGICDQEAIAILYQMETFQSREKAREYGSLDEKEARKLSSKKGFLSKLKLRPTVASEA